MCRQDTKAVPTALTGALGSKNTTYNSKWKQHKLNQTTIKTNCNVHTKYHNDNNNI